MKRIVINPARRRQLDGHPAGVQLAELTIEGLTTVFGNTGWEITTQNALRLVELAGHPEVPVARGVDKPLLRPYKGQGWRVMATMGWARSISRRRRAGPIHAAPRSSSSTW